MGGCLESNGAMEIRSQQTTRLVYNTTSHTNPWDTGLTIYPLLSARKEMSEELTQEVLRNKATEPPFSGKYNDYFIEGTYVCAGCGHELFTSKNKYASGCGWPSFTQPNNDLREETDDSYGMKRVEVLCPECGGHLGHVFRDGPKPTGLRYCINSAALHFEPNA